MSIITDGEVSVGCPPPSSSLGLSGYDRKSFQFHFHDFASLGTKKNKYIASPEFTCNGRQWQLEVYPGGDLDANEGKVSVYLTLLSEETDITAEYRFQVIDKFGKVNEENSAIETATFSSGDSWGWKDFTSRSDIVDESKNILDSNGTLTIVVSMRDTTSVFVPKNPLAKMIKEMFNDETTADVCFEVVSCREEKEGGGNKKFKASFTLHAHRSILTKCAPMLADLLGSDGTADITDIRPEIFHHLLYYVYGGEVPEKELKAHAKEIIDAADKYSIVNLKLAAEAAYVESTDITFDNAIDNLLYADAKNCALLKEKVMQFLADNHNEASEKISFTDCPGHVMKDLLIAVSRKYNSVSDGTNVDDLKTLSVSALRRKIDELGLEVDGSREAMIEAIKSHAAS